METREHSSIILRELERTMSSVPEPEIHQLIERVRRSKRIFLAGAGRSGLMARAFAMRLMQLGLSAYVVGETTTPSFGNDDLLIISSGSGETQNLVAMAEKASQLDGWITLITTSPDSTIGRLADVIVSLNAQAKQGSSDGLTTIQPMGSLFEQSLLILFDSIVLSLMDRQGWTTKDMLAIHANLE